MATYYDLYKDFPRPSTLSDNYKILDPFYDTFIKPIIDEFKVKKSYKHRRDRKVT